VVSNLAFGLIEPFRADPEYLLAGFPDQSRFRSAGVAVPLLGVQQGFLELLRQAFADALALQQTPRP
jgi:hypothetical protein